MKILKAQHIMPKDGGRKTCLKVMTQFVYCFFSAFRKMEDIGWTNFEMKNDINNNVLVAANTMSEIARLYAGKGMILRK